jgi:hypothetical protein
MAAVLGERAEPAKAFAVFARTTAPTLTAVLQSASVGEANGEAKDEAGNSGHHSGKRGRACFSA